MMISYVVGWLTFGLVCTGLELLAPGLFFFLSFAIGSGVASGAAWFDLPFEMQVACFVVTTLVSCGFLWLWARVATHQVHQYRSAVDALPGKKGTVLIQCTAHTVGQVQLDGQVWSAQSLHNQILAEGTSVIVIRVEGVRLIVAQSE